MNRKLRAIIGGLFTAILALSLACGDNENSTAPTRADVGTTWRVVRQGSDAATQGLAVHDTLVVAVGDGGAVYTSTDGRVWAEQREFGPGAGYLDVIWGLGQFVAVGMNGDVIVSTDGINWVRQGTGGSSALRGAAASGEHTIVVGGQGAFYFSEDNDIWTEVPFGTGIDFYDVVYDPYDKYWLVAASNGTILWGREPSLADTLNWIPQTTPMSPTMSFKAVACTDSACFVVGVETSQATGDRAEVYRSTDGLVWFYQISLPAWDIEDLIWTGTHLIAVGRDDPSNVLGQDGLVFYSEDGSNWTQGALGSPLELRAVAVIDSTIVAAGDHGYMLAGANPDSLEIVLSGSALTGAVYAGDRFVAVSDRGTVLESNDGFNWREHHSRVAYSLSRLAWSGTSLVTLGGAGILGEIYASDDGESWSQVHGFDGTLFTDVCWGGDRFVAVGYFGAVMVSSDGVSWTPHSTGESTSLQAVCWDGDRFLAGSFENGVYTSTDGISWSPPIGTAPLPCINRLTYGGGRYMAVGNSYGAGSILEAYVNSSTNAMNWSVVNLGALDTFHDIAWTGSHYVICGRGGNLFYSSNGTSWSDAGLTTDENLYDLATRSGQAVAVGANGIVLVSP